MSQQAQMSMGGPVGGGQPMNIGTPNSGGLPEPQNYIRRLNTAIYDHLLRNQLFDTARSFYKQVVDIETVEIKKSPSQRQNNQQQANGVDDANAMDLDGNEIRDKPDDLPLPIPLGPAPFLQDWWCQFWELHHEARQKGRRNPATLTYIGTQRQAQKARNSVMGNMGNMDPASMQNLRGYNGMMQNMGASGMAMPNDLKRAAAMQNMRNM